MSDSQLRFIFLQDVIYGLFSNLGFSAFPYLSHADKAKLVAVSKVRALARSLFVEFFLMSPATYFSLVR